MLLKQSSNFFRFLIALIDLILISVGFYLAYWLRFGHFSQVSQYEWLYYTSASLVIFLMFRGGVLGGYRYKRLLDIIVPTLYAFSVSAVLSAVVLYLSKTGEYSRLLFGLYFTLSTTMVVLEKMASKLFFDWYLSRGRRSVQVAVVGYGRDRDDVLSNLAAHPEWGVMPALVMDPRALNEESMATSIRDSIIDEVYIVFPPEHLLNTPLGRLMDRLEPLGVPLRVVFNLVQPDRYYDQHFCLVAGKQGVMLSPFKLDPDQLIKKRVIDIVGSLVGLIILLLVLPIVALAIKLESPGPIFFSQTRVGRNGRVFNILKFRSMVEDAEGQRADIEHENVHSGPLFKVKNDPRVTRSGRILRKYSIDELPQFWNVFTGEMALVGPRPPTVDEVAEYSDHHHRRLTLTPGMTGLWQVSGRNQVLDFESVVALDVQYIKKWSIWLDVKIMVRTLAQLLSPSQSGGI